MPITGNLNNPMQLYKQLPQPIWRTIFTWLSVIPASGQDKTFFHPDLPTIKAHLKTITPVHSDQARYESHQLHIDVHVCLSGSEIIKVVPTDQLTIISQNETEDYLLYDPPRIPAKSLIMQPRDVAILFPPDAHLPALPHGQDNFVRKIILKLPLRLLS